MKLEGKKVWITGASGAIGSAIAKRFMEEGAGVVGDRIDITDWLALVKAAREIRPDILVNCAGQLGPVGPAAYVNRDDWVSTIHVNLVGAYNITTAVIPEMLAKGGGKIILFSGGGAGYGYPYHTAYAASKAGLVRFVDSIAEEIAPMNIQINAIAPGEVKSRMNPDSNGKPNDAVDLALFLATEISYKVTGRLISAVHDVWSDYSTMKTLSKEAGKLRRIPLRG